MPNMESMAEHAKVLRYVDELLAYMELETDRERLQRAVDAAGWDEDAMKRALIKEGYMSLPAGKGHPFVNHEYYPGAEEHVGRNETATRILEEQNDLTIRAINRALGLSVPLPRSVSAHRAKIRAPEFRSQG